MTHTHLFTAITPALAPIVGGKASNLGVLTRAAFPVPPGFVIDTGGYAAFLAASGMGRRVREQLAALDFADVEKLEAQAAALRTEILQTPMPPALLAEISAAYARLGEGVFVAVRSSGTSEDSAASSSAGLHDTYLEIVGIDAVIDAVRRCWASLWTARAVSYRHSLGIDNIDAQIAVVVQQMVRSEISGVMFTGNPLTAATDEIVINASYGLGEAVVSGAVTPDQFVVKHTTLRIKERRLGEKAERIVHRADGLSGTEHQQVLDVDRNRFCLSDSQITELAALARRVQTHYGELPQDIEWGYAGGSFYLLQARPITGVEFSWDADLEYWQTTTDDDEIIWTRGQADEVWTGAITPLMYSWRAPSWDAGSIPASKLWGWDDLPQMRYWKYYKGEVYYNAQLERAILERTLPPPLRPYFPTGYSKLPPDWREPTQRAPFRYLELLRMHARVQGLAPQFIKGFAIHEDYIGNPEKLRQARGYSDAEIAQLSDSELRHFIERQCAFEDKYNLDQWTWFFIHARDMMCLLGYIVAQWYDGEHPAPYMDLVSGYSKRTATLECNHQLWKLSEQIRHSPELLALFRAHEDDEFFVQAKTSDAGRRFLVDYDAFIEAYGHRGHSDRDVYFPRRSEDPGIDYAALRAMLSGSSMDPEVPEAALKRRRETLIDEMIVNLRKKPFGGVRAEVFKAVLAWVDRFLMARDNERHFLDHATFAIRRGFLEVGRRLLARGLVENEREIWFLSCKELYQLLETGISTPLLRAKIAGRLRNFDHFDRKEYMPAPFLRNGIEWDPELPRHDGETLRGFGVARGKVTGVARLARSLKDIGRVQQGEILVVNSTDPGWTPVFAVIRGIVLETGGITAHGACLAREYGMPAVQISHALRLIPDGATITVDGVAGEVVVETADAGMAAPAAA